MANDSTHTARDMTLPSDPQAKDNQQGEASSSQYENDKGEASGIFSPQEESFWSNSIDASLINLSEGETSQGGPKDETASPVTLAGDAMSEEHTPETPLHEDPQGEPKAEAEPDPANNEAPLVERSSPEEAVDENNRKSDIWQEASDIEVVAEREAEKEYPRDEEAPAREEEAPPATDEESNEREEEQDEAPSDDEDAQQPVGFLKKKRVLYGCGALILIVIGVAALLKSSSTSDNHSVRLTMPVENPEDLHVMKFFLPLEAGSDKERFIKVTVAVALSGKDSKQAIERKLKTVRAHIIDLVLARSLKEMTGEKEINILREEITARLNQCLLYECVKETYFTELVVL